MAGRVSMELDSWKPPSASWAIFPVIWYAHLFLGFLLFLCIRSYKNSRLPLTEFGSPCRSESGRMLWPAASPSFLGHIIHILFGSSEKKMIRIDAQLIVAGMTDEHLRRDRPMGSLPHETMGVSRCHAIPHIAIAARRGTLPDPAVTLLDHPRNKSIVDSLGLHDKTITYKYNNVYSMIQGGASCLQK